MPAACDGLCQRIHLRRPELTDAFLETVCDIFIRGNARFDACDQGIVVDHRGGGILLLFHDVLGEVLSHFRIRVRGGERRIASYDGNNCHRENRCRPSCHNLFYHSLLPLLKWPAGMCPRLRCAGTFELR